MPVRTLSASTVTEITGPGYKRKYEFVRIDFASPVGTKRYTTYPDSATITLNVDGTSQVWTKFGVIVGRMGQDRGGVESVSWIKVPNNDGPPPTFTGWAMSPGIKGARVRVWDGYFFAATGAFIEAAMNYDGKIDDC